MQPVKLEMRAITKEFPGVRALSEVSFSVRKGEIHALVGENGAGKSTLMKILSGVYPHGTYSGDVQIEGNTVRFSGTRDSEKAGVSIIYQELALVKQLSIAENLFLGDEIASAGVVKAQETVKRTKAALDRVGLPRHPLAKVGDLGVGEQQLVEIAKAITKKADILILDEPTAALTEGEGNRLLALLRELRQQGVTCIYISHRLKEIFAICDRVTVLRDGKTVVTHEVGDINEEKLISLMVGRELTELFPRRPHTPGEVALEVRNWSVQNPSIDRKIVDGVSFTARKGEILGISGLIGAGRTQFALSLLGQWGKYASGELFIDGKKADVRNVRDAVKKGLCYLSEDRKKFGLVLDMDIRQNTTLAGLERVSKFGVLRQNEEVRIAGEYVKSMRIRTPSVAQKARNLSGGNQQKVVIAKWLMVGPRVLILDEPTRGIDVGAKFEIYQLMNELVDKGVAVMMISSDLPEILGMSDRILVMHEGKFTGELSAAEATQEKVMFYATGGK
jgi:D-xylose transport system ATP-binding protein